MPSIFLSVWLPSKPNERIKLNDIDLVSKNISDLKIDAEKLLNVPEDNMEFIHCAKVLKEDNVSLKQYGVRPNSTIHVFPKETRTNHVSEPLTEEQILKAVLNYQRIMDLAGNSFAKLLRPEVLRKVIETYPGFQSNIGAYAILRDSVLLESMKKIDSARKIAEQYPILIHSAEFVTKTIKEFWASNKPNLATLTVQSEDSLSDATSSDSDSPSASPNQQPLRSASGRNIRQISRDQLTAAILAAGSASRNSLSNIAQRNTSVSGTQQTAGVPSTSTSNSDGNRGLINRSVLTEALSQALLQATTSSGAPRETAEDQPNAERLAETYVNELRTMREMGLFDEVVNIQALVMSNGDVEAAINLVLSGVIN